MRLLIYHSLGIVVILSIGLNFGFVEPLLAGDQSCRGAGCNDRNSREYGCDVDAYVEQEITVTVHRPQDNWRQGQIIVQKMYSKSCRANWTRAYIPDDTYLFIKEQELVNNNEQVNGMLLANGTGYFWADSNMSNGNTVNQSCVALSTGWWFWYDRHCTEFN